MGRRNLGRRSHPNFFLLLSPPKAPLTQCHGRRSPGGWEKSCRRRVFHEYIYIYINKYIHALRGPIYCCPHYTVHIGGKYCWILLNFSYCTAQEGKWLSFLFGMNFTWSGSQLFVLFLYNYIILCSKRNKKMKSDDIVVDRNEGFRNRHFVMRVR